MPAEKLCKLKLQFLQKSLHTKLICISNNVNFLGIFHAIESQASLLFACLATLQIIAPNFSQKILYRNINLPCNNVHFPGILHAKESQRLLLIACLTTLQITAVKSAKWYAYKGLFTLTICFIFQVHSMSQIAIDSC